MSSFGRIFLEIKFKWFYLTLCEKKRIRNTFYWLRMNIVVKWNQSDTEWSSVITVSSRSIKLTRKSDIRRNNNKADSIETGDIVIAHLLPWSDLQKCMYGTFLYVMIIKFYHHYLIYKYSFACLLFWTKFKLTNNRKVI